MANLGILEIKSIRIKDLIKSTLRVEYRGCNKANGL
ncbi:hypothetical protein SPLC1_S061610 [Arthrospira platensis C1]|nr:hypothetical protein SPLC1_S061610 [Arthrospira platensis C1]